MGDRTEGGGRKAGDGRAVLSPPPSALHLPPLLDTAAAAVGEALRDVAWDREHGLPRTTPEMLRKVAGAVMMAAESYGVRSCRTCGHWERRGSEGWGACRLAADWRRQEPPRFAVADAKADLMTHETHGCRGWRSNEGAG